jgi:hypothetical protein
VPARQSRVISAKQNQFPEKIVLEACQVTNQRNAAEGLHVHNKHQIFINNLDRKRI